MPQLTHKPLKSVNNDAWLTIVYQDFDTIIMDTFKESDVQNTSKTIDNAIQNTNSKTNIWTTLKNNGVGIGMRAVTAGLSSSVAQSLMSKSGLSGAAIGRIQSSIYDIMADGKISNTEVAGAFVNSCVNELDSAAIKAGFPSVDALYGAIKPDGQGVAKDFMNHFQKASKETSAIVLQQKNKIAQDTTVLKFPLVTDDSETWASELPTRKTEAGFDIIDAIENSNITKDFTVNIVHNEYKGINMYTTKAVLEKIRDSKIPFDVYVNDPINKKQLVWKYCFFSNVNFTFEGTNAYNCTMSITKIPQYTVKTKQVSAVKGSSSRTGKKKVRKQKKATSKKETNNKTSTTVKKPHTATIGTHRTKSAIASMKSSIRKKGSEYCYPNGETDMNAVQARLNMLGVTTSPASLGITKHGVTK